MLQSNAHLLRREIEFIARVKFTDQLWNSYGNRTTEPRIDDVLNLLMEILKLAAEVRVVKVKLKQLQHKAVTVSNNVYLRKIGKKCGSYQFVRLILQYSR